VGPVVCNSGAAILSCLVQMQWGLAMLVPSTMMIPLSSLPPNGAVVASQAVFYLSLASKSLAGMNAFTSSSAPAV
jgi:hypothetical protein